MAAGETTTPGDMKEMLEALYRRYNRREFVHPDPLEFLYRYEDPRDMEVAGLVAAGLAYGRVERILASVSGVLGKMGSPARYVRERRESGIRRDFRGFRHRFTGVEDLVALMLGMKRALERFGSLEKCFLSGVEPGTGSLLPALGKFVGEIAGERPNSLLSRPQKGSACKRLWLFLRWMVRRDRVDPGVWNGVSPSMLLVPLDTHMHRISLLLGLTARRCAGRRTAEEVTESFREISPEDPVKYDFTLTRFGIRTDFGRSPLDALRRAGAEEEKTDA